MEKKEKKKRVLAIDFGASGGRAMVCSFQNGLITLEEIHRFTNDPVSVCGTLYWDVLRLFYEIRQSILKAKEKGVPDSIAVDTWGVDFGMLDKEGRLLEAPVHYRDARTEGQVEKSREKICTKELYQITGNQIMEINTLFQLLAVKERDVYKRVRHIVMMPDLFRYFLTGEIKAERSIASTSQMLAIRSGEWSETVMDKLELRGDMFPEIIAPGTAAGLMRQDICRELQIEPVPVTAVCGHDTQSALVAVPAKESDFIFLSCGTWSLLGTELDEPVVTEASLAYNMTNESGYEGKISFLKNITGLWLLQESRRQWMREGKTFSFAQLEQMAEAAAPLQSFVDPDDPVFARPGNIPKRIQQYCKETGQIVPEDEASIVRCIDESLAMKYREAKEQIAYCTGKSYDTVYMVGGGIKSRMLCQMTAEACGCLVSAGPVEATVLGNAAVQLITLGVIENMQKAREIIRASEQIQYYEPEQTAQWNEAYQRYKQVTNKKKNGAGGQKDVGE